MIIKMVFKVRKGCKIDMDNTKKPYTPPAGLTEILPSEFCKLSRKHCIKEATNARIL